MTPEYRTWLAMKKYADEEPLTDDEWRDLSALTLINREHRIFEPGNCRWATSDSERRENERFYRTLRES